MIKNYFRPDSLEEAVQLLNVEGTVPLGGGTWLNQAHDEVFSVVDLQSVGLNKIRPNGNNLEVGACITLQDLVESNNCPETLKVAIRQEMGLNIRNAATIAGTLVSCNGRSPIATVMLAMDARISIIINSKPVTIGLGEFLPIRPKGLITSISLPINITSACEGIARSPADKPVVYVALSRWASGRTRLALGGFGNAPILAMDGTEADGIELAARNAFSEADDAWASSQYRLEVAGILAKRCFEKVGKP
jgi:CO/xanthine dehydrogenase FAD-binding subunit